MRVTFSLLILGLAPVSAATIQLSGVGEDFILTSSGFIPYTAPPFSGGNTQFHLGRWQTGIENGIYRAVVEYDLRVIPNFATINSAIFTVSPVRGFSPVSVYYGEGIIDASDTNWLLNSFQLPIGSGLDGVNVDITDIFRSFYRVGTPWLGFHAYQDPGIRCNNGLSGRTDDSCTDRFTLWGNGVGGYLPILTVNYTPLTPPPPPPAPIPEPGSFMLTTTAALAFAVTTRRFRRQ